MSIHHTTDTSGTPAGPAAVLEGAREDLAELVSGLWSAKCDDDVIGTVEQAQRLKATLSAVEACAVAEVEARDLAKTKLCYGSTGDWLTHAGGLRRGHGKRLVKQAIALTGPMSATLDALADGTVSPEQAWVVVDSVDQLPSGERVRSAGETHLLGHAGSLNATDLARAGRHLVRVVDPEGEDRKLERDLDREERAAHLGRTFSVNSDGAGGVRVRGRGSAEDGAVLKAALLSLTRPAPATDPKTSKACAGAEQDPRDPRDHGVRTWDALIGIAQHSLDTDRQPEAHGAHPRVTITLSWEQLTTQLKQAQAAGFAKPDPPAQPDQPLPVTHDGIELSPATVRRLACDAEIIPSVLGTRGQVLDVGQTHRLVTAGLWTALVIRDQHCAFPACDRPPVMCHAHHITHWADHGPTRLDNLVMLCGHHHRTIHHTPWEVRINDIDRLPEFLPPPKPGHTREWIRHRPRLE